MNRLFRLQSVLLLLCSFAIFTGCDDTSTTPDENNNNNDPGKDSGFRITGITRDTFYTGERAWITVKEMGDSLKNLSMFVHTVPATLLDISGDTLFFEIPRNATTSKVRLYKNDTLEAKGEYVLHLLPHHIDFDPFVTTAIPNTGYVGDVIRIFGSDFPLRKREVEVSLNGVKLTIEAMTSTMIQARLPAGVESGPLDVKLFDKTFRPGSFTVLTEGGRLLNSGSCFEALFNSFNIDGEFEHGDNRDSTSGQVSTSFGMWTQCSTSHSITRTDSLRASIFEEDQTVMKRIKLSLKETTGKNEVSGKIEIEHLINKGTPSEIYEHAVIVVDKIRWKFTSTGYELYAEGTDVTSKVRSIEFLQRGVNTENRLTSYRGGTINSQFSLKLR